ncbi:SIR2 family protein [Acinetobacter sp. SwsAc5]|uniref:SIR2 family protein n=1 Tax=Acinetobacter sp. SwsAc5 TaxID=2749438 RepID=UPI002116C2D7|nr:SIR2 family protein [Acinetobacter sp. SwsAc5]
MSTSCDFLNGFPNAANNIHWLSSYGKDFTEAVQEYIHTVASHLFDSSNTLPSNFKNALIDFIKNTKSHVATLNYDKLLYDEFIKEEICKGYSGYLVDGFYDTGFAPSNMERLFGRDFGYYMHLHGCPLFKDISGITYKLKTSQISTNNIFGSKHIVLTHIPHKPSVITASEVLSTYWSYLILSLSEVKEIILFGYSGCDIHLNKILKVHASSKNKKIIEWDGDGQTTQQRQQFWDSELGANVTLQRMPDITQFTSW